MNRPRTSALRVARPASPAEPVDVTQNLSYRIVTLANSLGRSASRAFAAEADLSVPEWRVVSVIGSHGEVGFNALARTLDLDKGWISRTLVQLEAAGFVARTPDPRDARQFTLALTRDGRALHLKGSRVSAERQQRLRAHFSDAEYATLLELLGRLQQAADEML